MNSKKSTEKMVKASVIAALYAVLMFIGPSFEALQFRVSEILTILPAFDPSAIPGLTLGCVVGNIYGAFTNQTPGYDIIVGSFATFVSAILTRKLRHIKTFGLPLAATLPPVIINAIVVGTELMIRDCGFNWVKNIWLKNVYLLAFSQFVLCTVGGTLLAVLLEKTLYRNQNDE